ncbi:Uroporphyrinogen III synthase HEM4 [Parvibaculum lavamentivorans DS-1]|uniref:Uroporphyrinogen-III synthase n=1 Tax=Parvibaculum lavamentivorans (strain DS-1 / DSM 13023 / NCIMB 13966) TaxID=402881 RepID=A7HST7_PARL1|nr:uroporphyrinogen-III synthase [Parvibaculum lavamentivorans]ABS62970.1 Uroporphyrinogen III synthase HEM4 [Parvibaculum lavamentivorans DS-1]
MKLLVTRPEADSEALAETLAALGHEAVQAPLLTIRFFDDATLPAGDWQALLVTSANGARALGRREIARELKSLPVLAVGPSSAAALRREGFVSVKAAGGDVEALAALAVAELKPEAGPLLHIAGSVVAGDLGSALGAHGFTVERAVFYEAELAQQLPETARRALEDHTLEGVLFYSPRTARAFTSLVMAAGLKDCLTGVTAYCLSRAVADELRELPFGGVKIAARPEQPALLALISA